MRVTLSQGGSPPPSREYAFGARSPLGWPVGGGKQGARLFNLFRENGAKELSAVSLLASYE